MNDTDKAEATEHELRTWPPFFQAIDSGRKTFEVRKNDRGYQAGDVLWLREWNPSLEYAGPEHRRYTGNAMHVRVTYVLSGSNFGIVDGYVVMGIERVE